MMQKDCEVTSNGVVFHIDNVRCLITFQALHDSEDQRYKDGDECVRFQTHRSAFERIARTMIAEGNFENDGTVKIINGDLTDADLKD